MTEKRFILDDCGSLIDMQTRDTFDYVVDVIDLLNSLNDENEEFKKALIELKEIGDYQDGRIKELSDENEQLKQSIKEVVELLSEEVDVFSEKATEHDIIAYRELNQLDNKDAYYMATATKKAIRILKELQK